MKQQLKQVELKTVRIQGKKHHIVPIEGYSGYFVTPLGKVVSCVSGYRGHQAQPRGASEPRLLKQRRNSCGYRRAALVGPDGKVKHELVHRLVAKAYLEEPDPAPHPREPNFHDLEPRTQVNHIDGNKRNNKVSNLEWNSPKENHEHNNLLDLLRDLRREMDHDHLGITKE